jgi:hypothetical protein
MGRIIAGIVGIVVFVAVVVYGSFALYEGSWSLASHNLNHSLQLQRQNANGQAQNNQAGWSYQTTLGERIVTDINAVNHDTTSIDQYTAAGGATNLQTAADEKNQRQTDAGEVCALAVQVNAALPPSSNTTWIRTNCDAGNLKPSSVYYVTAN